MVSNACNLYCSSVVSLVELNCYSSRINNLGEVHLL